MKYGRQVQRGGKFVCRHNVGRAIYNISREANYDVNKIYIYGMAYRMA